MYRKKIIARIALEHLMTPEYKGDLQEYIRKRQEEEKPKQKSLKSKVINAKDWFITNKAVRKTIDDFIGDTQYQVAQDGGNFYFYPKDETYNKNISYPLMFVSPSEKIFISDSSAREREIEVKNSKKRTPQHEPPMGAKEYTLVQGVRVMLETLSEKQEERRYSSEIIKNSLNNYHPTYRYNGPPAQEGLHDYIRNQLDDMGIFTLKEYDRSFYSEVDEDEEENPSRD